MYKQTTSLTMSHHIHCTRFRHKNTFIKNYKIYTKRGNYNGTVFLNQYSIALMCTMYLKSLNHSVIIA